MPRTPSKSATSGKSAQPQISAKLLEELIPGPVTKEEFEDIFQNFKKAFIERALNAEMKHHLGYSPGKARPDGATNHRNGSSANPHISHYFTSWTRSPFFGRQLTVQLSFSVN